MLETPILFLIFNRPDTTFRVFESIRKQKPAKLYIAADGPRNDKKGEAELCLQAKTITEQIDWKCEIKTLFRENNLGCKIAIKSAIDWFFEQEEMGIILEDDCLPCDSFYSFCEQMLKKYQNEEEIMMVSGTNYLYQKYKNSDSYYKSVLTPIWGWATWKRAWNKMDLDLSATNHTIISGRYNNKQYADYLVEMFINTNYKVNSWAVYWLIAIIKSKGYSIMPLKNQISNIGLEGSHSGKFKSLSLEMPTFNINSQNLKLLDEDTTIKKLDELNIKNIISIIKYDNQEFSFLSLFKTRLEDSFNYKKNILLASFKAKKNND